MMKICFQSPVLVLTTEAENTAASAKATVYRHSIRVKGMGGNTTPGPALTPSWVTREGSP